MTLPSREQVLADFWESLNNVRLGELRSLSVLGQQVKLTHRKPVKTEYAHYNTETREIQLNNNMKGQLAVRVLMHELEHAKLRLTGFDYHVDERQEEQLCTLAESYFEDIVYALALLQHIGKANG